MPENPAPKNLAIIGGELAIAWHDEREDFLTGPYLRERSPSAENIGEPDLFGNWRGGESPKDRSGVELKGFEYVGNYAVRLIFSDGHSTGIFSWEYLRKIAQEAKNLEKN